MLSERIGRFSRERKPGVEVEASGDDGADDAETESPVGPQGLGTEHTYVLRGMGEAKGRWGDDDI